MVRKDNKPERQDPVAEARYWRERAERLDQMLRAQEEEISRLRASLARKEVVAAGEPRR